MFKSLPFALLMCSSVNCPILPSNLISSRADSRTDDAWNIEFSFERMCLAGLRLPPEGFASRTKKELCVLQKLSMSCFEPSLMIVPACDDSWRASVILSLVCSFVLRWLAGRVCYATTFPPDAISWSKSSLGEIIVAPTKDDLPPELRIVSGANSSYFICCLASKVSAESASNTSGTCPGCAFSKPRATIFVSS